MAMTPKVAKALAVFLQASAHVADGAVRLDAMKHDIQGITATNFDGVIGKFRDSAVSSLWFYRASNSADEKFLDSYNGVAAEMKGMAKICAINCDDFDVFCEKNKVTTTPTVMIYPTNPMPAFVYEGKMEQKPLSSKIARFFPDFTTKITKDNVDTFVTTDPTKPKVLLFSSKKSAPMLFKALSSEIVFKRTVKFGFIAAETDKDVATKFKVTKFPHIMMIRGAKAEIKDKYDGDITFLALKDWVNLHSESGMGDKVASGAGAKEEVSIEEAKPWLVQEVPEVTQKSHQDICFRGEGLCVIYLSDGDISAQGIDMLSSLSKKFTSQLSDRGAKMKWMWMNVKVEEKFKDLFEPAQLPSAVVFNPHKRLRFTKIDHGEEGEVKGDEAGITNLVEKVLGGDARFKMVPGQKLPAWAARSDKTKKEL